VSVPASAPEVIVQISRVLRGHQTLRPLRIAELTVLRGERVAIQGVDAPAAEVLINLVTGVIFFVATPEQYIRNVSWWAKVFFLLVATTNIVFFETRYGRTLLTMPAGITTPAAFKVAGVVSIVSWLAVLYFGRMLPFLGNAF